MSSKSSFSGGYPCLGLFASFLIRGRAKERLSSAKTQTAFQSSHADPDTGSCELLEGFSEKWRQAVNVGFETLD